MVYMPHWPKFCGAVDFSKDRIEKLKRFLELIGSPHLNLPPVVHITGTNGKGSTVTYLKSILQCSGYLVSAYTSPHLIECNERFFVNGASISDKELFFALEKCRLACEQYDFSITFFEAMTITGFMIFAESGSDILLLEVGMGGRLDATNVIERSLLSIFTSISLDHTEFLGSDLSSIAVEKSEILKYDSCAIIGKQNADDVVSVLEAKSRAMKCSISRFGKEWFCEKYDDECIKFGLQNDYEIYPMPTLAGKYQILNLGAALAALSVLYNRYTYDAITYDSICTGIKKAFIPGRLQSIICDDNWEIIVDGAHNSGGAKVLSEWLAAQNKDCYAIVGMTKNRKGESKEHFFDKIAPYIKFLYGVCVRSERKAETSEDIVRFASNVGIDADSAESVAEAIEAIKSRFKSGLIIICGSLYLVRDIHIQIHNRS